jgi:hypothetical protein
MVFLRKSYRTEIPNLLQFFGNICLLVLKLNCYLVQPITLKLMDRQKGKIKYKRTC